MADALGSGPSGSNPLEVQVLSSVLYIGPQCVLLEVACGAIACSTEFLAF